MGYGMKYGAEIARRPKIHYAGGCFYHNCDIARVVLRKDVISVGCSDVTIGALRALVKEYESKFGNTDREYVLQE